MILFITPSRLIRFFDEEMYEIQDVVNIGCRNIFDGPDRALAGSFGRSGDSRG